MHSIRSLVLGALLSVWQYVKCQDQDFPINSPYVPIPTFSRSSRNPHIISPQDMNQLNIFNRMNYENPGIGEVNQNAETTHGIDLNMNRNHNNPMLWHQSKSMSKMGRRRLRDHRMRDIKARGLIPNMDSFLKMIEPELSALDLELNLPFTKNSSPKLYGRRSAMSNLHDDNNDNETSCYNFINMLLKIKDIKEHIQDLENEINECINIS